MNLINLSIRAYRLISVVFTNEQYIQISSDFYCHWEFKSKCSAMFSSLKLFFSKLAVSLCQPQSVSSVDKLYSVLSINVFGEKPS